MGLEGGLNLGTAYANIVIKTDGIDAAIRSAKNTIDGGLTSIGSSISNIGDGFSNLGSSLTTLTAPILAFGVTGIKAASDFQDVINQVRIFGNLAPDQLEVARQAALKWGADTKFSSLDAASGMLDLLKSGLDMSQVMAAMPPIMSLAAAGNISLAQASGIVSGALAQFRLKAEDAGRVSNALAQAANASKADVIDLGQGLNNVGPIAAQFGLSVEDTSAVLAVFANNNILGAEAGTQLKSMLLNLARPTDDVKGAFQQLGVSLYDNQGNVRDFNTVLVDLDSALDKLPVQQQNELMQTLAGSYGITGLSALRASGGIDAMRTAMANSPDAAKVAEEQMKTFSGRVESLTGSIQTLQQVGLTPLMDEYLAPLVDQIIGVVNSITEWVQANPELAGQIVRIVAVIAAGAPIIWGIGKAISAVGGLVSSLGTIIGFVLSPIGLLIAAAVGLYLAFQSNFLGIRDLLQPVIDRIGAAFGYLKSVIFDGVGSGLQNLFVTFEDGSNIIGEFLEKLLGIDPQQAFAIGDQINNAFNNIVTFITGTVIPALQTLANWFLTEALPAIVSFVTTVVIPGIQAFFAFLGNAWAVIGPALAALADWFITTALPAIINFITTVVIPGIQTFIATLVNIWISIQPGLQALFDWFVTTALPAIVNFITTVVIPGIQNFITTLVNIWTSIQPGLQALFDWFVTTALPAIVNFIQTTVIPGVQGFIDLLLNLWTQIQPGLQSLWDWFTVTALPAIINFVQTTVIPGVQGFIDLLVGIWTTIQPGLQSVYDWFVTNGLPFIQNMIQGTIDNVNTVVNVLSGIWNAISPALTSVYNWFVTDGLPAIQTALQWFNDNVIKPVSDALGGLFAGINNVASGIGGAVSGIANSPLVQGIGNVVSGVGNFLFGGSHDYPGPYSQNMAYMVGKGAQPEAFIPSTGGGGMAIPNFDKVMAGLAGGGQSGPVFKEGSIVINASTYEGGRAAGRGFKDELQDLLQARGNQ